MFDFRFKNFSWLRRSVQFRRIFWDPFEAHNSTFAFMSVLKGGGGGGINPISQPKF